MSLTVSLDNLRELPAEAAYRKSNGRAHVEATRKDGVIYITGTCDSLQRLVEYYEELYHNARDALENYHANVQEEAKTRESPLEIFVKGLALGFFTGISLTYFIKQSKSHKK